MRARIAAIHAGAGEIDMACLIFACHESSMALLLLIGSEDTPSEAEAGLQPRGARNMNTKTAQLIALISDAKTAFTGIDWDTGPSSAAIAMASAWENAAARDAALADGEDGRWERAEIRKALSRAVEPEGGTFWREDGSYSSQCLDRDWRDLGREVEALHDESSVEDIETARQHAEWIADAEARAVEGNAEAAGEYGDDAIAAAEAADWDAAVAALEEACRCEREYGDDPSWGPALKLARELADAADETADDEA